MTIVYILNLVPPKNVLNRLSDIRSGVRALLALIKVWVFEDFVCREVLDKLETILEKFYFIGYLDKFFT